MDEEHEEALEAFVAGYASGMEEGLRRAAALLRAACADLPLPEDVSNTLSLFANKFAEARVD